MNETSAAPTDADAETEETDDGRRTVASPPRRSTISTAAEALLFDAYPEAGDVGDLGDGCRSRMHR